MKIMIKLYISYYEAIGIVPETVDNIQVLRSHVGEAKVQLWGIKTLN